MKILITGASGYVGAKIYQDLRSKGYDVWGTYNENVIDGNAVKVDLTKKTEVDSLIERVDPDVIIHLAADAQSKTCEDSPEYARKINVDSTKYLVDNAKTKNIRFIHLSTFACFNPSNVYGKTKLEAEQLVATLDNYVIFRASMIIGLSPNTTSENFFNSLLSSSQNDLVIEADTSWKFETTCINHLSKVIELSINNPAINQVMIPIVAKGVTSRYKITKDLLASSDQSISAVDQNRVIPLPEFNKNALTAQGLPEATYEECIKEIADQISTNYQ